MIDILIVDDHPSVMEGTKMLLEQEEDLKVMLAQSGKQAIQMLSSRHFHLMLIDLQMPDINGIDLAKKILSMVPDAIILIYTGFEFSNHFNLMVESGISGFVSKTATQSQLVAAVRCALRGEVIVPISLVRQLRRSNERVSDAANEDYSMNDNEYEILKEIAAGKSNKEIAELLFKSQRSLEYAITNLFHKLNVKSRVEAVLKAKQMGVLKENNR